MSAKKELKELKTALTLASKIIGKSSLPILSCVKLSDGRIEATNLEQWLSVQVPFAINRPICIDVRALKKIIATLKDAPTFSVNEKDTLIINGAISLPGLSLDEWPMRGEQGEEIAAFSLPDKWGDVSRAMSLDETRFNIRCLALQFGEEKIAATDGHRLHIAPFAHTSECKETFLVPYSVAIFVNHFPDVQGIIYNLQRHETTHGRAVSFTSGTMTLHSMLVDGEFPDYSHVIPATSPHAITVNRAACMQAVQSCQAMTTERTRGIILYRYGAELTVKTDNYEENGNVRHVLPCSVGEEVYCGINVNFLLDAVESCRGEEVTVNMRDELSPLAIKDNGFLSVIMPCRVSENPIENRQALEAKLAA